MQTRTTLLHAPRDLRIAAETTPAPGPGEVLVELTAVGVCGSDVHWYLDGCIGENKLTDPLTLGHEPAGRVLEVGSGVDPNLKGRRIAIEPAIHCGTCRWCLEGHTNLCPNVRFMGTPPTAGAFRERLCHPASLVAVLPDGVSDEIGALLEPLAIGVHVADLLKPRLASTYVIQGAGPIGLCSLLALRMFAPAKVIVVEPLAYRRELAKTCGADHVFDPADPGLTKEILRLTGGYGADYVVEAVGREETFARMVDFAAPGAKVAVVGIEPHDRFGFACGTARRKGLTLIMVRRSRHTLERAIELTVRGAWHPEPLVTHRRSLADLGQTMELVAGYQDGVLKALVDPRQ